jgi:sterol desaturase/sphingolipid hydroxylase (fatty acid hydroxylase superfamily)
MDAVETLLLNPASVLAGSVAYGLMARSGTTFSQLCNPWSLDPATWVVAYVAVRMALLGFIDGFVWLVGPRIPALPSRTGPKPVFQHTIGRLDVIYLLINSAIEFVFTQQLAAVLWSAPYILRVPGQLGILNGPAAWWLMFVVDDMLYAPLHRFMHHPRVYKYVHKHHHRNTFPARGYIDGANEHPVEQLAALSLHWIAMHLVAATTGLHVIAVFAHLGVKALGACFNHTGYDLRFNMLGIDYSVRAHEMHHRKPNTNFAQYVMAWDRLMGTFKPYESGQPPSKGADAMAKPEADRLPAWADPALERSTGQVAEKAMSMRAKAHAE